MHPPQILSAAATLAALCTLAAPTPAQSPQRTMDTRSLGEVLAQSHGLADVDGTPTAAGPRYLATFRDGIEFTPVLGDTAPRDLPLRLRVVGIRRGDHALDTTPAGAADLDHDRRLVQRRRGDAVTERYAVRAEGVEQSFVFEQQPAGTGDLVVTLQIDSELQGAAAADGTVAFTLPGIGGVHIGQVTGIDAAGRSTPGQLRLRGDRLDLILPDGFVAAAAYPMVLDPLIGTQFAVAGSDSLEADVAYDDTSQRYLVAWRSKVSFANHDIRGQLLDANTLAPVGGTLVLDNALDVALRPRVGNVAVRSRFLVAWQKAASPFDASDLWCRSVDAGTGALSATIPLATTNADEVEVCVSGEATGLDDEALVFWREDTFLRGREVTLPPAGNPTPLGVVTLANTRATELCASKTSGFYGRTLVAWTFAPGGLDTEIQALAVTRDLVPLGPTVTVTNNARNDRMPAVDGDGATFILAYAQEEAGNPGMHDILCARLQFTGGALQVQLVDQVVEADAGEDETGPDTAWLGTYHCVVFTQRNGALQDDVIGWLVSELCTRCNARIQLTGIAAASAREYAPRLCGEFTFNNYSNRGLIVFAEAVAAPPFTNTVVGQQVTALGSGTVVDLGGGCGNGGVATTANPFAVGSPGFAFTLSGAEPTAVLFLSLGFPAPLLPCGACGLVAPVAFEFKVNVGGTAISPFPTSCDPSFAGLILDAQWVSFATSTNPCPQAASLAASNRLRCTLGQ